MKVAEAWVLKEVESEVVPVDAVVEAAGVDANEGVEWFKFGDDAVFDHCKRDCGLDFKSEEEYFEFSICDFGFKMFGYVGCVDSREIRLDGGVVDVAEFDGVAVEFYCFFDGEECFADCRLSVDRFCPFFEDNLNLDVVFVIGFFVGGDGVGDLLESTLQNRHGRLVVFVDSLLARYGAN